MIKEKYEPTATTFTALISAYGKLGQLREAMRVYHRMVGSFINTTILCNSCSLKEILGAFLPWSGSANLLSVRVAIMPSLEVGRVHSQALGDAKKGLAKNGLGRLQVELNCERNIITYGSLITACEKDNKWEVALSLLDDMRRDSVQPNTMTFNALLSACAQGDRPSVDKQSPHLVAAFLEHAAAPAVLRARNLPRQLLR